MAIPVQDHVKEIVKLLEQRRYSHDLYTLFSDNVAMMAMSISNAVDMTQRDGRERHYMDIVGRYDKATVDTFPKVMAHVATALEDKPQDVLGSVFNQLELHNKARGQFFTPYELSKAIAHMQVADDLHEIIKEKGYVTAQEPACGSGSMIIALAEAMHERGVNYQQHLHVQAVDIDERAAHMAYVQFSLLHIPAEVIVGNTLSGEVRERFYTPAHIMGGWSWRLGAREQIREALELETPQPPTAPDIDLSARGEQLSLLEVSLERDLEPTLDGGMEM